MIIDSHAHLHVFSGKPLQMKELAENLKLIMKENNISRSILLPTLDDNMDDFLKIKDDSLLLAARIRITTHFEKDLANLKKLLKEKLVVAVKLYPGYEPFYPDDKRCEWVYDLCEKYNVPVIFHSGETFHEGVGVKYAHPILVDDIAIRRPNMKIVISHMGNPWINDTMVVVNRNRNVYADISGLVWKFEPFWVKHYQHKILQLLKWSDAGETKLIFGTDWPCNDCSCHSSITKQYIQLIRGLKISQRAKKAIFCENAASLFNLKFTDELQSGK